MSAYKNTSPQKAAAQQTLDATIPMAQNSIPGFVAAAADKMAEGALLVQDKAESNQDIVAAPQADDVAQELSQLVAALDVESVPTTPLALDQLGGPVLLAQAAQSNASDGGIDLLVDPDGGLTTTGWAAVVGAGVLVAAAAGGGGGGGSGIVDTGDSNIGGGSSATYDIEGPSVTYVYQASGKAQGKFNLAWGDFDGDGTADDIRVTWYPTGGGPNSEAFHDLVNCGSVTSLTVENVTFTTSQGAAFVA